MASARGGRRAMTGRGGTQEETALPPATAGDAAGTTNLAIEIIDVSVSFGGLRALDSVSMAVRAGEIRGLIGPNGAGKSTLVNVVAGDQRRHEGQVHMGGRPITGLRPQKRAQLGLARTFQHPELSLKLTMGENLAFGRNLGDQRDSVRESLDAIQDVVDGLHIRPWMDVVGASAPYPVLKMVDTLRAVITRPAVLLVDEPAAGLPKEEREKLVELLTAARDLFGTTIVVIEHDVPLVFSLCERITVLDSGRLIADGTAEEIRNHPEVIEAYLGVAT
jgi:ABC-type branched-subunit amino acid transport system ATPase component